MDYEGRICRTPGERGAFKLPISVGCPYNACAFCDLFKDLKYRELPLAQIEEELARVSDVGGAPKRIMLGDGNAFFADFERLVAIVELIERYLPSCESISSDASVPSIAAKTDQELAWLAAHGYRLVYIGIESGLDDVLAFMHKDHDNGECRAQIERLHAAGIEYGAHIMTGCAGAGRGSENARATAAFLNETRPVSVCNFSMGVSPTTTLGAWVREGRFTPADRLECLREERELIALLDIPTRFEGFHFEYDREKANCPECTGDTAEFNDFITDWTHTRGTLPRDRERLLALLDSACDAGAAEETLTSEALRAS